MAWSRIHKTLGVILCIFVADILYERKAFKQETINTNKEKKSRYVSAESESKSSFQTTEDDSVNEESVNKNTYVTTGDAHIKEEPVSPNSLQTAEEAKIDKDYIDFRRLQSTMDDNINGDTVVASDGSSGEDQKLHKNLTSILDLPTTGNVHSIWSNDSQCNRFNVKFSSGLPLVWLASFPRSGNTWTRYLIEAATGVWTNSIYNDPKNTQIGYLGEMEPVGTGRCVVSKTHIWKRKKHIPTILVIRNPAKSIVSFWNFHIAPNKGPKSNKYFFNAGQKSYERPGFRKWVARNTKWWKDVTARHLKMSKRLLVIVYEELCKDPIGHMQRILEFLGLQEDPDRMACLAKYIDGKAKGAQREIDPYTPEEKVKLREAFEYVREIAELRGIKLPNYAKMI